MAGDMTGVVVLAGGRGARMGGEQRLGRIDQHHGKRRDRPLPPGDPAGIRRQERVKAAAHPLHAAAGSQQDFIQRHDFVSSIQAIFSVLYWSSFKAVSVTISALTRVMHR
mgnify:CR=1 FL=1